MPESLPSMSERASEALSECLKALEADPIEIKDCVARFPEVSDLETLLIVAQTVRQVLYPALPSASKNAIRQTILARYHAIWHSAV